MELWGTDSSWAGTLDCAGLLLGDSQAALQVPARGGAVPPELAAFESITVTVEVRAGCINAAFADCWCLLHACAGDAVCNPGPKEFVAPAQPEQHSRSSLQAVSVGWAGWHVNVHPAVLSHHLTVCAHALRACASLNVPSPPPTCDGIQPRQQVWTLPAAVPELSPAEAKAAAARAKADPKAAVAAQEAALAALPPQQKCKLLPQELVGKLCLLVITPVKVGGHPFACWCDAGPAWLCQSCCHTTCRARPSSNLSCSLYIQLNFQLHSQRRSHGLPQAKVRLNKATEWLACSRFAASAHKQSIALSACTSMLSHGLACCRPADCPAALPPHNSWTLSATQCRSASEPRCRARRSACLPRSDRPAAARMAASSDHKP